MADLRHLLEQLPFSRVQTYIQSGNLILEREGAALEAMTREIEAAILAAYEYHVPTLLLTPDHWKRVIEGNPFIQDPEKDIKKMYLTFLWEAPDPARISQLRAKDYAPEEWVLDGTTIYFYSPNGYGRAKMNNNFFEQQLKVAATTRNWRTVNILYEMATL